MSLERSLIHKYRSSQASIRFGGLRQQSCKKKPQKTPSQFLFLSLQINMKLMDPTVISNFPPIIPEKWKGSILQEKGMLKPLNIQKKKYGKQDFQHKNTDTERKTLFLGTGSNTVHPDHKLDRQNWFAVLKKHLTLLSVRRLMFKEYQLLFHSRHL